MRMYSPSGRSRWPLVILGGVVAVGIVGGVAYGVTRPDEPVAAPTAQPTATPAPIPTGGSSGAGDNEEGVAPTGCLGGNNRDANMVLTAQAEAPHTTFGAVEVATAMHRWLWQYPSPSEAEATVISANLISASAPDEFRDVAGYFQSVGDNPTNGQIAPGTPFYVSSTNGIWGVTENSTAERIQVTMATRYVIDGALSPTETTVTGFAMVWEDDAWRVAAGVKVDQEKLGAGGTGFTGGC